LGFVLLVYFKICPFEKYYSRLGPIQIGTRAWRPEPTVVLSIRLQWM